MFSVFPLPTDSSTSPPLMVTDCSDKAVPPWFPRSGVYRSFYVSSSLSAVFSHEFRPGPIYG